MHFVDLHLPTDDVIYDMLLVKSKQAVVSVLCGTTVDCVIDLLRMSVFPFFSFHVYLNKFCNK